MKSLYCKLAASAALLLASLPSQATTLWGWSFDPLNLGVLSSGESIDVKVTVFNHIASDEALKIGSFAFGGNTPVWLGNQPSAEYSSEWGAFSDRAHLSFVGLAPGESYSFTLGKLIPDADGAAAGSYSAYANFGSADNQHVYGKLTWQVAAVPEPETVAMLLAGLGVLGLARRRRG